MNRKGFTTIELITSFTLASVIMIILFNIILIMKDNLSRVSAMTNTLIEKDNLSYNINKRLKEKELASLTTCSDGDECYQFTYSDSTSDKLVYSSTDKTITFNNYTFNITDDMNVEVPTITEHYDTMSSTTFNGYLILNIPITVDGKDYSIKVNKHFNTDSVMVDLNDYQYDSNGNKYTLVEYLQSTGTQYIDTGIYPKSTISINFVFEFLVGNKHQFNGWGSSGDAEAFLWGIRDNYFSSLVNSSWITADRISNIKKAKEFDTMKHTFMLKSGKQIFDNESYGNDTIGDTATSSQTMYLFATHVEWNGKPDSWCEEKIYSTKIYDSDTLVRDFVPVIDSSNRPCLFDKVSKECYYNQGTGEFLYG